MMRPWVLLVVTLCVLLPRASLAASDSGTRNANSLSRGEAALDLEKGVVASSATKKHYDANSSSERLSLLVALRDKLQLQGMKMRFMDKAIARGRRKLNRKRFERLIQRAKKRMAKRARGPRKGASKNRRRRVQGSKLGRTSAARRPAPHSARATPVTSSIRGSLNPCPTGQTRRRGRCRCPALSTWDDGLRTCACIYGTYRDATGNCRTFH